MHQFDWRGKLFYNLYSLFHKKHSLVTAKAVLGWQNRSNQFLKKKIKCLEIYRKELSTEISCKSLRPYYNQFIKSQWSSESWMSQSNLKKVMQFTHVPLMLLIIVKNFLPYTNFLWFIVVFKEESKIFLYLFGKTVFSLLVNGSTLPLHSPLLTAKSFECSLLIKHNLKNNHRSTQTRRN